MSFYEEKAKWNDFSIPEYFASLDKQKIEGILAKEKIDELDFLALLSPSAEAFLERMAQKANKLKEQHFGNTIFLYIPIYVSNYCNNGCSYCGFALQHKIARRHLNLEEIEEEAKEIAKTKIEHIILLTGEAENVVNLEYIQSAIEILKKYFSSVTVEVIPLEEEEYASLSKIGLDGMTVYQETYSEKVYEEVHLFGKKKNYRYRLETPERAAKAGLRTVNIGALFGLHDIYEEAFHAALHLQYLMKHFPNTSFGISLPRINHAEGDFTVKAPLDDFHFVQFLLAYRIFQPTVDISISTRERAYLRKKLLHLGITRVSAGSKTDVGGYALDKASTSQFDISDARSVEEVAKEIEEEGFQVIYKDWEAIQ